MRLVKCTMCAGPGAPIAIVIDIVVRSTHYGALIMGNCNCFMVMCFGELVYDRRARHADVTISVFDTLSLVSAVQLSSLVSLHTSNRAHTSVLPALDGRRVSASAFGPCRYPPATPPPRPSRTPWLSVGVVHGVVACARQSSGCQVQARCAALSQTGRRRLPASSQTRAAP